MNRRHYIEMKRALGCPAPHKRGYETEEKAQKDLDYFKEHGMSSFCAPRKVPHRYYSCSCGYFHLTSMTDDTPPAEVGKVGFVRYAQLVKTYYKNRVPMAWTEGKWVLMKIDTPRTGPVR